MGLLYFRVTAEVFEQSAALIDQHEAEPVGPRARGYWTAYPTDYDYAAVKATATTLAAIGAPVAHETLLLTENQANALPLLELDLPDDDKVYAASLFTTSLSPARVVKFMQKAKRRLGTDPDQVAGLLVGEAMDERFSLYFDKQLRHLREALPLVWRFYERAIAAGDAILVVDLRARDLDIPEAVELDAVM